MLSYLLISGLAIGALYALIAIGIVLVYKATGIVNFAHGELFMVSGFFAYTFHVLLGLPYAVALILALGAAFLLGIVIERVAYRPLMRANYVSLVLATVGIAFILRGIARNLWGGLGDYLAFPPLLGPQPIILGSIILVPQQLFALGGALLAMAALALFFAATRAGKAMQATADNPKAATLVGIRVDLVYMITFGVGALAAAGAAVLMAPLTLLYPDMGFAMFIKGFAAAALGGLTSLPGAVLGGVLIGLVEALAGGYIHSKFMDVSAFVVIMAVLVFRPTGLLGARAMRKV